MAEPKLDSEKIKEIVSKMTLEEKAALTSGMDNWHTKGVERLGIPKLFMSDGPHGLRIEPDKNEDTNVFHSKPAICFPADCLTASSFDTKVAEAVGEGIGEECLAENVDIILGPSLNTKRSPLCGRNFEYMSEDPLLAGEISAAYIRGVQSKGVGTINDASETENELLRYIETGKVKEILQFYKRAKNVKSGVIADNSIRQLKNQFIIIVALACRAAIRGGLSSTIALPLAGVYIQQAERLIEMDAITTLTGQALVDFTNRVANSIIPTNADSAFHNAVQYVRQNTNQNITVSDVADHVGFSRSYLSRKFKKEFGFELNMFIRQCKLEEAKDLLAYSNKSISEISNYLCFSSQSHFQKAFKSQFGITPHAYRKSL